MPLTADSRIVAGDEQLKPLAEVLADEIAMLTGLKLKVTAGAGRAGDIVLKINKTLKAGEQILMLRNREPVRTTDGAHTIAIDEQAVVEGFDYRATAEGTSTHPATAGQDRRAASGCRRLTIKDWPHADYCGVMLDVARQDHPIDAIKKVVQLCRLYKARYLQLHLTDDQGWTFPSTKYPQARHEELRRPRRRRPAGLQARRTEGAGRLRRRPRRDARARVGDARPLRRGRRGRCRRSSTRSTRSRSSRSAWAA